MIHAATGIDRRCRRSLLWVRPCLCGSIHTLLTIDDEMGKLRHVSRRERLSVGVTLAFSLGTKGRTKEGGAVRCAPLSEQEACCFRCIIAAALCSGLLRLALALL